MLKTFLTFFLLLITLSSYSQVTHDLLIGVNLDLIKSHQSGYFQRGQFGGEANYFLSQKFTATAGVEYWTQSSQLSAVIGTRWYPVEEAYIRVRGLIGSNDLSIGGGWAKPLKENWRFESMADIYFDGQIAIRAGFAYLIKR
jgi:hypothetical protein